MKADLFVHVLTYNESSFEQANKAASFYTAAAMPII